MFVYPGIGKALQSAIFEAAKRQSEGLPIQVIPTYKDMTCDVTVTIAMDLDP